MSLCCVILLSSVIRLSDIMVIFVILSVTIATTHIIIMLSVVTMNFVIFSVIIC